MAKFISRCDNQVLTIKPQRNQILDGVVFPVAGEHIRFDRGQYETSDKNEIAFIRKHRLFGSQIIEETPIAVEAAPTAPTT